MVRLPEGWRDDAKAQELILAELRKAHEAKFGRGTKYATPGELARAFDPRTKQTPALDLIDAELVRAFNTPDARLIISMPPQEGKSTRVGVWFPLWVLSQKPDTRIVMTSFSDRLARRNSRNVRSQVRTNGAQLGISMSQEIANQHEWRLADREGGIFATPVGGELTGQPADLLLIDDPHKGAKEAESEIQRDDVWEWWQSTASARLAPGAPVILILTRWHEDDLAGRFLSGEDAHRWRVVNIPARADHDPNKGQTDPLGREPGQWLQSARGRTDEQWRSIEVQVGSRVFNALYQGRPSPDSGDVWKRQWWRRYDTPLWSDAGDGKSWNAAVDELLISGDLTFKDTKSSDFVVLQVWGKKGANAYLLDQIHKRMSFTETLKAFTDLCAKWPGATAKLIEDKANGTAVIDTLKQRIPGIIAINPTESKYARASAVAPFIEAGNVWLPTNAIAMFDVDGLIDEAAGFPNAAHDDQVDGASQALSRMFVRTGQGSAFLAYMKRDLESRGIQPNEGGVNAAAAAAGRPVRQPPYRNLSP